MVKELNKIDYTAENYIFYESNDNIFAESSTEVINLSGIESEKCRTFQAYDFNEKEKIISKAVKNFVKTDPSAKKNKNIKDKYTPSYSESTSTSKVCALYNNKGQGSYGNCWAAAVATIANYRNGTNITPTQVCDFMGIGYDEGGDTYDSQSALSHYGVYLNNEIFAPLSWSSIKYNIDNAYPSYASLADNYYNGHAVTVYGYRQININQFIVIWNSGLNGGSGGVQIVYYYSTGTTIPYNNKTWTWIKSLCWIYLG
ncbi:hypothetical protein HNQ56_003315 [Anaerotaenia torta]|uniref:hypothetical protein n=1 Tax=Anaerotaenia torta TaxID=433293 RepID=UPI003D1A1D58